MDISPRPAPELAPATGLQLHGRVMPASNATFVGRLEDREVVYKPIRGERPLWDFPDGNLAYREVAAYLVSETFGGSVVPRTWLADGPHGPGMLQEWCTVDPEQSAVTIMPAGPVPAGWRHVFDGLDADDEPVSLVHEDTGALRRIAVLDVVLNNADRKGGHVLEMPGGHRHGIDHGVALHHEPKLRTVLWGWAGEPLTGDEIAAVRRVRDGLADRLASQLGPYLSGIDLEALGERCDELLREGTLPVPDTDWHWIPWPPF